MNNEQNKSEATAESMLPASFSEYNQEKKLSGVDMALLEQAIRHHWDIPVAIFKAMPHVAAKLLADQSVDPRSKCAAMRTLLDMNQQNHEQAQALGLEGHALAPAQETNIQINRFVVHTREEAEAVMAVIKGPVQVQPLPKPTYRTIELKTQPPIPAAPSTPLPPVVSTQAEENNGAFNLPVIGIVTTKIKSNHLTPLESYMLPNTGNKRNGDSHN